MSRRSDFLLLVQTGVLTMFPTRGWLEAVALLGEAARVPEEAIPEDVPRAATEWLAWRLYAAGTKPEWVREHEENVSARVK